MADGNAVAVQPIRLPTRNDMESASWLSLLERAARDPDVDIAKMERLFEMQEKASARQSRELYLAALSAMQAKLPAVARLGSGHNSKKYARFEDIIDAIKPVLAEHGFSLTFRVKQEDKTMTVVGVLGHSGGHAEETAMTLPADMTGNKNPVQSWGSTASYGKRYVTLTITGIATEDEDDDGKKAGEKPVEQNTIDALKALIVETKADLAWICNHYSVEALEDLTGKQISEAITGLLQRKRQQVKK